jgi:hypothetical protein
MVTKKRPPTARRKKTTAKATSRSREKGIASVEKGRTFEDDVAALYRLQGGEVIQGIEINQKKVDLLVTFTHPVRHRVIVECKDETKAVNANQRVMQFHGLLDIARKTQVADSAEIITRVPWGDAAKGFAYTAGINLLTYTEKLGKLIDFTPYLRLLSEKFEKGEPERAGEPPLGAYYVDLSAEQKSGGQTKKIPIINSYIDNWLRDSAATHHLAIFGEYGSGKSSLCHKLVFDLANSYLKKPGSNRIPILLNLRDFIGKIDIEAYVTSFLDRQCGAANPKINLFKAMNDAGTFLLIFDGFDEMAIKVDSDTLEANLIEIEKLASSKNSKVLLTSRPEYFISTKEEIEALTPARNPFATRATAYQPLKILPWNEVQVAEFLKKRVPLIKEATKSWTFYRDRIKRIGSLSDLAHRPVLLDMIVKTLPRLIASNTIINLPNLYESYLTGEIKRQKILKRRSFLLDEKTRLQLLEKLAVSLYLSSINEITFADALDNVETTVRPPKQELEAYTRDFLTNSFLIRRGDTYHFSHKSIAEYLVATRLSEEIQNNKPETFGRVRIQPVIVDFLKELKPDEKILFRWIKASRSKKKISSPYLGGNAATLLISLSTTSLAGKDLTATNLTGASLYHADLKGTQLKNTVLKDVRLEWAKFHRKDIERAKLRDVSVIFYNRTVRSSGEESWRLAWNTIEKEAPGLMRHRSELGHIIGIGEDVINEKEVVLRLHIQIKHERSMDALQSLLSACLPGRVAVYREDVEKILGNDVSK